MKRLAVAVMLVLGTLVWGVGTALAELPAGSADHG
jgi:hypothetical protein